MAPIRSVEMISNKSSGARAGFQTLVQPNTALGLLMQCFYLEIFRWRIGTILYLYLYFYSSLFLRHKKASSVVWISDSHSTKHHRVRDEKRGVAFSSRVTDGHAQPMTRWSKPRRKSRKKLKAWKIVSDAWETCWGNEVWFFSMFFTHTYVCMYKMPVSLYCKHIHIYDRWLLCLEVYFMPNLAPDGSKSITTWAGPLMFLFPPSPPRMHGLSLHHSLPTKVWVFHVFPSDNSEVVRVVTCDWLHQIILQTNPTKTNVTNTWIFNLAIWHTLLPTECHSLLRLSLIGDRGGRMKVRGLLGSLLVLEATCKQHWRC